MEDFSNICLSCGLCCDGSLIGFVELTPEETLSLKEIMEVEDTNGNGFFLHPCSKYCNGCTIYQNRPKKCNEFNCKLLFSVENKNLNFDSALQIINLVKHYKSNIENKIETLDINLKSNSFYFKMVELKKILHQNENNPLVKSNYLVLSSDIKQLDKILSENFGVTLD